MNDPDAAPADDELNLPLVSFAGGLPESVREARTRRTKFEVEMRASYEARTTTHIHLHRRALAYLAECHEWIADNIDFDLHGDTRLTAVWQMAGHCLGIARLTLDALELGYTAEVLHLGRAVHEANRLLGVFHMEGEDDLVRKWLAGEYVRPAECRQAEERFDQRLAEIMQQRGEAPMPTERGERSREMYGYLSEAAHHRRKWTEDVVFSEERMMFTGPTSDFLRRAATTGSLLLVVEETVMAVGDALSQVLPQNKWYETNVKPLLDNFETLRKDAPLPG